MVMPMINCMADSNAVLGKKKRTHSGKIVGLPIAVFTVT